MSDPTPEGVASWWAAEIAGSSTDDDAADNPSAAVEVWELPARCRAGLDVPELRGFGPLDPLTAATLALSPPTFLRVELVESESVSASLPVEPGYHPSAPLARAVRQDHPACSAPTCTVRAEVCELDHVVPFPRGETGPGNLRPLCKHHHVLKTHGGHHSTRHGNDLHWRTAAGHCYRRTPDGITTYLGRTTT